ncbi:hypothetical protein B0H13DRAFT_1889731 [Mycena leptocephala]|nr:hypothetical protein B0H13DRAFT_1889731 [Mycena leptocephala]
MTAASLIPPKSLARDARRAHTRSLQQKGLVCVALNIQRRCFAVLFAKVFHHRASNRIPDLHNRLGVLRLRDPYKDYPGFVYAVMCPHVGPNGVVDYSCMEIKVGITNDSEHHMHNYKKCGDVFVKWIEQMVHLTLKAAGAHIHPYRCAGCGHRHQEFFFEVAAGRIEGVAQTIEEVMASVGQVGIRCGIIR